MFIFTKLRAFPGQLLSFCNIALHPRFGMSYKKVISIYALKKGLLNSKSYNSKTLSRSQGFL